MYSKKFGRLILGFCTGCSTSVVNGTPTSTRTTVSWTSVCKHHTQFLERRSQMGFAHVRDNLLNAHGGRRPGKPLAGLRILDVGCGGGLLTEPLGRLGADVLGIDPVADSIGTAEVHAWHDPDLRGNVRYRAITLEELSEKGGQGAGQFDAVVASEVVEHLADLETFTLCCNQVLKPGGSLFITTINKTQLSYALAIVAAEEVLRIVPSGTHDWDKFVSPMELERLLESNGFHVESIRGMLYNPLSGSWSWTESTSINYALHAVKLEEEPNLDEDDPEDPTVIVAQAKARRWYN
ncbi:ubiquinone biosynthesis O-methyltransferase, mitochondrial isoform X2 [Oncorhynchus tshawytscha]|uniref:ubiquinone biosynthesis O-methyltransferase, mitochondrial isoform X2 n=1 Tax=Oncorhynchus tshawytscha TaxID=74940 RepID=UPI000D09EEC3|nr:ubiquinone biosynthesis O-methyltransferase, mitochondrial isoform X2 [Oncorhynchus tshawytscha]